MLDRGGDRLRRWLALHQQTVTPPATNVS